MNNNAKKIYDAANSEAVFTEPQILRRYLIGFDSEFGYVITDEDGTRFYTDSRYMEAATERFGGTDIEVIEFERGATAYELLKKYKKIGIPMEYTYAPVYNQLVSMGIEIVDTTQAFVDSMAVKSEEEISSIKSACVIADKAIEALYSVVREGMTESELAAELEYLMRNMGASGTSFDTISAFGPNGSMPHYETGSVKLKFGDIILMDFGCKVNGYCSDSTRTFLFGDDGKHEEFKEAYGHVLDAQLLAIDEIASGMTGKQADAIARRHLARFGLDKYFTHSLGHGMGLNIHEAPRLSLSSTDVLKDGMVFSDEPGVYFPGKYGIRIEDSLTLENGRVKKLTESKKELIVL